MKKLLSLAGGIILTASLFSACEQPPNSTGSGSLKDLPNTNSSSSSSTAYPVIVYERAGGIAVMDSDCSHRTTIFTSASGMGSYDAHWAPSGVGPSVCFSYRNFTISYIAAVDVGVSSGVPFGSNFRLLDSLSVAADSMVLLRPSWSSTSTINQIAYVLQNRRTSGSHYVCRMSANGGSRDTLYTLPHNILPESVTWNPTDSKLAVSLNCGNSKSAIVIINTSTKAVTDSIPLSSDWPGNLDWSRTSTSVNKLLMSYNGDLNYLTPTSGSTPSAAGLTHNGVSTWENALVGTWSPSNGSILYTTYGWSSTFSHEAYYVDKVPAFKASNKSSRLLSIYAGADSSVQNLNWRRY